MTSGAPDPAAPAAPGQAPDPVADSSAPHPPRRLLRGARNLQGVVGRTVLVGITFVDPQGGLLRREQAFGVIAEAADGVVTIERQDGAEPLVVPPDEQAFRDGWKVTRRRMAAWPG